MDRTRTNELPQLKPRADDVPMACPSEGQAILQALATDGEVDWTVLREVRP